MRRVCLSAILAAASVLFFVAEPAWAILQFNKQFLEVYINDHPDKEYAEFVKKKARCWVCHQGKKRTNHNHYGEYLKELLDKKEDKDDKEKIRAALKKVGQLHSDSDDPKSKTFDELIADSKLPGGKLDDLKKEPDESEPSE